MKQSRVIASDAVCLYHLVTDVIRAPEWHHAVRRAEWCGGADRARPEARFVVRPRSRLRRARHFEVTVAVPGRRFAFLEVSTRGCRRSTEWTFSFEPAFNTTELTCTVEPAPGSAIDAARLLGRIAATAEGRARVPQPRLGQVHTAEGPLDLSATYVMHHGFRRDLRDLVAAVPATPQTDNFAWAALDRRWQRIATTLHHHHQVEDDYLWPALLARDAAGDPKARTALEAMHAEHARLDPAVEACADGFRAMATAPERQQRDRLAADLAEARSLLLEHLAHEETDALPIAQRHLSVAAAEDFEKAARREYGLAGLGFAVPWSTLEIPPDQFEIAYAHGGTLVRAILALTRGRFERQHLVAFRHLPGTTP